MGMRGGVACGAASDGSAGILRRNRSIRFLMSLRFDVPGTVELGCCSATGGTGFDEVSAPEKLEIWANPREGFSDSKPEPASGSPPTEARCDPAASGAGGSGCCRATPFEAGAVRPPEGGGTALDPPLAAADPTLAMELGTPLGPEPAAANVDPDNPRADAAPATAPTPAAPAEPTAIAALPTMTPVESRSPPVNAGAPPRTAENSRGICQQSIIKINAAPITSKAVMYGCADVPIPWASASQPLPSPSPAEIRQYRRTILTPIDIANPRYLST